MFLISYLILNFYFLLSTLYYTFVAEISSRIIGVGKHKLWMGSSFIIWKWFNRYKFITDFYLQFVFHSTAETV